MDSAGAHVLFLPTMEEALLLRGCLRKDSSGAAALAAWCRAAGDPATGLLAIPDGRRLVPLLDIALRQHAIVVGDEAQTKIRAAALYSRQRATAVANIAAEVLDTLATASV